MNSTMIVAATLLLVGSYAPEIGHKQPAWLDSSISGYLLEGGSEDSSLGVHDAKTGFFLIRDFECDGAIKSLLLTRDRELVSENGYRVPGYVPRKDYGSDARLKNASLRNLSTGLGVSIGDPEVKLRKRLGPPTSTKLTGPREQFTECHYRYQIGKGEDAEINEQTYTFKEGKLIQIEFEYYDGQE